MKTASLIIAVVLAFAFQSNALALEANAQTKVTTVLKTQSSWNGRPIEYPAGKAEITGLVIELAPGAQTGWHTHAIPNFAYILEGELEIEVKDGLRTRVKAGEAVAEVVDTLHNGHSVGTVPLKLVVFYAGVVDGALSAPEIQ